jgi:tRNA dimethylallyltransferase
MQSKDKTIIVIAGPTAVGKTSVAIQVALALNTEIISTDSRQCYREMNIGVARPTAEELAAVKHHFIASRSIQQKVTAATFESYALEKTTQLFQQHNTVVMVGGTGLYIKAFCEGLDIIPEVPDAVRNSIVANYTQKGLPWLQQEVAKADPQFYASAEIENPHRLMRALEVLQATGQSIMHFRKGAPVERPFNIIKIGLQLPKEELHQHINSRVDNMIAEGLVKEVETLLPWKQLPALQTVGYRELFDYFEGQLTLPEAVERIKINTRHYAKRQLTWFKKDKAFHWLQPQPVEPIMQFIKSNLS